MGSIAMIQSGSCIHHKLGILPRTTAKGLTASLSMSSAFEIRRDLRAASSAVGIQGILSSAFSRQPPVCLAVRASAESKSNAELVKDSWRVLKRDAGTHATAFFLKIFEIAPTAKQLFSFMRDSTVPAEANPHLKSHALVVFTMTCEAAILLGEDPTLAALRPKLLEMGHTHVVHKVIDEHFDVVKYALLETLKEALKDEWSPSMKAAWAEAYDAVTKIIKDEMHAVRRMEVAV
ncbi:hemoglobin-2 isoform X1 [Selaginella moellendorffii]|uniref:hemoglobin-2 isoform X1 n=1 Tax=Selaginella moellendorffii TaxID=88036 RepID=UPI000D1CB102|nr:hemoglobin-2 isoform X1 [Selaginella moellendorffii]|eukprot:XP_002963458.2 hemoglobin-2 isoform X1 [Selaginella moellendorffii]